MDYLNRALSAYYGHAVTSELPNPSNSSAIEECNGRKYVALRNVNGLLAVYRITTTGQLKRLKRWPKELECW